MKLCHRLAILLLCGWLHGLQCQIVVGENGAVLNIEYRASTNDGVNEQSGKQQHSDIEESATGINEDTDSRRPWLGVESGCLLWNPTCADGPLPGAPVTGYFLDDFEGAGSNEPRCLFRALEFHAYCGRCIPHIWYA